MRRIFDQALGLAKSRTAKDTYILFLGNLLAAFLGFVFTLIVARALSIEDFGVLSAATNLIVIISSLTDLGVSSGLVNFASFAYNRNNVEEAHKYAKASFIIKIVATVPILLFLVIFSGYVARNWIATNDIGVTYWVAIISFIAVLWAFLPYILQAQKRFLASAAIDVSLALIKAIIPFVLTFYALLSVNTALASFAIGALVAGVLGFRATGLKFLFSRPKKEHYLNLAKFSSWIGVNRIISSISGRLDIQMLAALAGAAATGVYSIPVKLSSFVIVLSSSFTSVLAPRFAAFGDAKKEKAYLVKALLAIIPIVFGIIIWIIIARPFIVFLFGEKYIASVGVFQALAASMIPFVLCTPSVTAIIYSMKKTVYIGAFSFFQIVAIFVLNYIFIPIYGPYGPTIAFGVVYTVLMIYSWVIVIRYYWLEK